jgi:NADH-quinone oxidoreductase subunit H
VTAALNTAVEYYLGLPTGLQALIKFLGASAVGGFFAAYLTYFERKVLASIQSRIGPNRAGPLGLLQPIADLVKLIRKEDIIPRKGDPLLFSTAPYFLFVSALLSLVVVPLGRGLTAADLNIGLLYLMAVSGLSVIGIFLAGWGSNNKYSLYGAFRSVAQLISYELPMGFALLAVAVVAGSLQIGDIVQAQQRVWFVVPLFFAFILFLLSAIAETNRTPFDLPEAESELVAGYFTEYSGMRFGLFFAAEYMMVFINSAFLVNLFLGGWLPPWPMADPNTLSPIVAFAIYWTKLALVMFTFIWIRATLPRLRVDQLMGFCWKVLVPVGMLNLILAALIAAWMARA